MQMHFLHVLNKVEHSKKNKFREYKPKMKTFVTTIFKRILIIFLLFSFQEAIMDPQQQFCLKWNSYSSNLAMTFSNLFKSELLADVTLFCGGKLENTFLTFFQRPMSRQFF